jgi:hypothetical protein
MCARTHKCESCFEEYVVSRCCESGCEEWNSLLADVKTGFRGSLAGSDESGVLDPCRYCNSYINNDAASFEDGICFGWKNKFSISIM